MTTPTLYHASTTPNVGWWVATVPTLHGFQLRRIHKDPGRCCRRADLLADAKRIAPEVAEWTEEYVLPDGRAGFFTGKASIR